MKEGKGKTVRFEALLKNSGAPEPYVPWGDPAGDKDFQRAVSKNRVVTIHQTNVGSKKDFGVVGYHPQKQASFLVFPRELDAPASAKVIGIKYERINIRAAADVVKVREKSRKSKKSAKPATKVDPPKVSAPPKVKEPKPPTRWRVQVKLLAEWDETIEIEAKNVKEARSKAVKGFDFAKIKRAPIKVTSRVVKVMREH